MTTSASGARIQGDDYQHLFAWCQSLQLLDPGGDVESVEVESASAGNLDDVVVKRTRDANEYFQVKYSVDASRPISSQWFTTPVAERGLSPLQRFTASWRTLKKADSRPPEMVLFTNRVLDPADPILKLRDGLRGVVGPRLREASTRSAAGRQVAEWASHVGSSTHELLEMLDHLSLRMDQGAWSMLVEFACARMAACGLSSSPLDAESGVSAVRSWVKNGVRSLSRGDLEAEIDRRSLRAGARHETLLVQAIDRAPWLESARWKLDWVDLFEGDEPRARRQLKDPALWMSRIRPDLVAAAKAASAAGGPVFVRGFMRLPLWFLCGIELPDVRGHHVACIQGGQLWSSEGNRKPFELSETASQLDQGPDVAIGLSVTNVIGPDVVAFCAKSGVPVSRYVDLAPQDGVGRTVLPDADSARGWVFAAREAVRRIVREAGARRVHLFVSGPAGGVLLLGHSWNRMGTTVIYEDLSPGYAPTFEIPG